MAIALFLTAGGEEWVPRGLCPLWGVRAGGQQSPWLHSCHLPLYKDIFYPHFPYPSAVSTVLLTDAWTEDLQPLLFSLPRDSEHRWVVGWQGKTTSWAPSRPSTFHDVVLFLFSPLPVKCPFLLDPDPQWRFTFLIHSSCLITTRRWQGVNEIQIR